MSGPSSRPNRNALKVRVFVPHPDDAEHVREAFEAVERGQVLSVDESAAYLHWLETGEAPDELRQFFETGERSCPASPG